MMERLTRDRKRRELGFLAFPDSPKHELSPFVRKMPSGENGGRKVGSVGTWRAPAEACAALTSTRSVVLYSADWPL